MRYRHFAIIFFILLAIFVAGNYAVWKLVVEDLVTDLHYDGGDLSRMGYIPGSKIYRHNSTDLPRQHMRINDYDGRRVDMITIGDSFSNGGGGGYNRFYQDYISSNNSFEVLNLNPVDGMDFISTISILLNNGFIEKSGTRYILISATEIGWKELAQRIDNTKNITMGEFLNLRIKNHYGKLPKVHFINNGNFKFLLFNALYPFSEHAVFSKVYKAKLTKPLFSAPASQELLYLPFRSLPAADDMQRINDNLNELSDRLAQRDIKLVFMPFADKYTIYAPWLEKKRFPESAFFELIRPLPKRYTFIDTKALLREELERGEKDVYYPDDTHSSWKASRKIFSTIHFGTQAEVAQ